MWVLYKRKHLAHFEVHTDNHLENWFGHFKNIAKPSMSMRERIAAIVGCDKRTENDYLDRCNRVDRNVNRNYDSEIAELQFTNHFVAGHIENQYIKAVAKVKSFLYDTTTFGSVVVSDITSSHTVLLDSYDCTCSFANTMKLLCQHANAYLKTINSKRCIPLTRIHRRCVCLSIFPYQ
ncbi:unnamed protein product [Phytophthora fragariaefolia]|uniref:Unnamed protein product n=1 Tax=Phytophthora fragariaefolia TaxID=1490495 RepID=A0A9W7CWT1_9STRA|nr:unnamed protein product [Phytophthora fragariaefolia]